MSDCISRYLCAAWKPPPFPEDDPVLSRKLFDFANLSETFQSYMRCCQEFVVIPDISSSTATLKPTLLTTPAHVKSEEVATASIAGGWIALIVILVVVVFCIGFVVLWLKYKKRHVSMALPLQDYKDINYLDNKACNGNSWTNTNAITPPSLVETRISNSNSDRKVGPGQSQPAEMAEGAVEMGGHRNGRQNMSKKAAASANIKTLVSKDSVKSKIASKNGVDNVNYDPASMDTENCDNFDGKLTPVETVEQNEINETDNMGNRNSGTILRRRQSSATDDVLSSPPDLVTYDVLNSNNNVLNTQPRLDTYNALRRPPNTNSENDCTNLRRSGALTPINNQSQKNRNSDSQVMSSKKRKRKLSAIFRKSEPVITQGTANSHLGTLP